MLVEFLLVVLDVGSYLCTGKSAVSARAVFPRHHPVNSVFMIGAVCTGEVIGKVLVLLVMFT